MEPEHVTFQLLEEITNGFSEERMVGQGSFGVVYRGLTKNGEDVAVKKLRDNITNFHQNNQFQNELNNLMKLRHQNIVRLFGYCYQIELEDMEYDGRKVQAEKTHRALCLEYLKGGSLQMYLSDETFGLDWHTRFNIIKGICEGLKHMHEDQEKPLLHLDLKPANILLDKDMVPKLADFGLSTMFGDKGLTRTTESPIGTPGYQPPEYVERREISEKFDIFSLGVVMKRIVLGPEGYTKNLDIPSDKFIDVVKTNWRNKLQETWSGSSLEAYCQQVETCTQIALDCMEKDTQKRPDIVKVINKLNEIEVDNGQVIFKATYWTRLWSSLQNKAKRPLLKWACRSLKTIGVGVFAKHGWPSSRRITHLQNQMMPMGQHDNVRSSSWDHDESVDIREESLGVGEEFIVGREKEQEKIMASLLQIMTEQITILPIYGIGGIGKTTFAKLIYNDIEFNNYSRVWVYVSPIFDLNKVGNSIISQLSGEESQIKETQIIHSRLNELFSSKKKILIVLDDLWEDRLLQLVHLKDMLNPCGSINIIVLVTTRSTHVAENMRTNIEPHQIEPLTNDMCWHIIEKRSGFEAKDDKEQQMNIGKEIALKCRGVALAAQAIGFMLRPMELEQWMEVKDSEIWNESISKDATLHHVFASLKLSYTKMAPCLRSCFTYCAIFPKGHIIIKEDLIHQWISLGFVEPTNLQSSLQLCENYVVQLLGLSFFQHPVVSPKSSLGSKKGLTLFTMHDLVHDLARLLIGDKILDSNKDRGWCYRYACLTDCCKPLKSLTFSPVTIEALHFRDCAFKSLKGSAFLPAKSLRVLDLSGLYTVCLPDSIGDLVHLRYLNAPGIQSDMLPGSFTKLSELTYLNLSGSDISALPDSIGEMNGLMHLDISGCRFMQKLPKSFANLKSLVYLDLSNLGIKITAIDFGGLTNIQHLNLSNNTNLESDVLGELQEVISSLTDLRYLYLSGNLWMTRISSLFDRICTLPNLVHLDLSDSRGPVRVPESIGNLKKLHTLDLSDCCDLYVSPECMLKMESVKVVNLDYDSVDQSKRFASLPSTHLALLPKFTIEDSEFVGR